MSIGGDRSRSLARRLRSLRRAAYASPDGMVLLDPAGRIHWHNRAAERLLGIARVRDRRQPLVEVVGAGRIADWLQSDGGAALETVSPIDPQLHLELTRVGLDGGHQLFSVRDISHLIHLEQVRQDFVANVSHELRTPLTVIHGYLELLEPDEVPALAPVLGEMRVQSRRMTQIVEDLLTLSRLEGQRDVPEERVPMDSLLATLNKEALALSQGRHEVSMTDALDWDLLGSPDGLLSAFSNLVSNAVRYTPTGGNIAIRWQRSGDGAAFSVTDSGYGIPEDHLARLTERFYRVSTSRSRELGGTGLGLSIVKHVLNLHQGKLEIESAAGKGSRFTCHFDAARLLPRGVDDPQV